MINPGNEREGRVLFSRWDFYALFIMLAAFCVYFTDWPRLPYFVDCYYHLSVMRGFEDAGGWVGRAFWEFAPVGRPHLYPPLFHFLELILFKAGMSPILIARYFDFSIFPIFLFLTWLITRKLYGSEFSFFSLFLMASSRSLYLALVNNIPFSLSFILGLLSFYFFKKTKPLSACICMALSLYTHPLMPWLIIVAFVLYGAFDRKNSKGLLSIIALAICLALPLLIHQARYLSFCRLVKTLDFYSAQINPILLLLAGAGVIVALQKKGAFYFLTSLLLSLSFLVFVNRDRFLSGQGMVPFSFLAALALMKIREGVSRRWRRPGSILFFTLLVLLFNFLTPLIILSPLKKSPDFALNSWMSRLFNEESLSSVKEETIYNKKFVVPTAALLNQYSDPDDIFYSNYNYAGGMISVVSGRATSTAMLKEVGPFQKFDPIQQSRFVLWFKETVLLEKELRRSTVKRYGLKKLGETDLAYLYLNPTGEGKRHVVPAKIPTGVCFTILFLSGAVIIFEPKVKNRPGH